MSIILNVNFFGDIAPCGQHVNKRFEEYITSFFRVENQPSKKEACSGWLDLQGAISQKMATDIAAGMRKSKHKYMRVDKFVLLPNSLH
jgi:hypothetical protein